MTDLEFLYNLQEDLNELQEKLDTVLEYEILNEVEKCEHYESYKDSCEVYCSKKDEYIDMFEDCLNCEERELEGSR